MSGSYSSAGIIRIRFAGRNLSDFLSAWDHQAPRAGHYQLCNQYKLLFKNVKIDQENIPRLV